MEGFKPGNQGGLGVKEIDYEAEVKKIHAFCDQEESPAFDLNGISKDNMDMKDTVSALSTTARRKAATPWSVPAPAEIFLMRLNTTFLNKKRRSRGRSRG